MMKYIQKEDLVDIIQEKMLEDSIQETDSILENIEGKAIAFVISYISGRYKTDEIFNEAAPLRHPLLVQIIAMVVVYRAVRRNAARKVPEDYKLVYDEAVDMLEKIQSGRQKLSPLPEVPKTDETGSPINIMWGNSTNKDYFI